MACDLDSCFEVVLAIAKEAGKVGPSVVSVLLHPLYCVVILKRRGHGAGVKLWAIMGADKPLVDCQLITSAPYRCTSLHLISFSGSESGIQILCHIQKACRVFVILSVDRLMSVWKKLPYSAK